MTLRAAREPGRGNFAMSDSRRPGDQGADRPTVPLSDAELIARRQALEARLTAQRAGAKPVSDGPSSSMRGAADGMKLASEFVAGVLAGAGIGYLLDKLAGTQPFGLIVFLLLGFVAGVLNVLRSLGRVPPAGPTPAPRAAPVEKDPDPAD